MSATKLVTQIHGVTRMLQTATHVEVQSSLYPSFVQVAVPGVGTAPPGTRTTTRDVNTNRLIASLIVEAHGNHSNDEVETEIERVQTCVSSDLLP